MSSGGFPTPRRLKSVPSPTTLFTSSLTSPCPMLIETPLTQWGIGFPHLFYCCLPTRMSHECEYESRNFEICRFHFSHLPLPFCSFWCLTQWQWWVLLSEVAQGSLWNLDLWPKPSSLAGWVLCCTVSSPTSLTQINIYILSPTTHWSTNCLLTELWIIMWTIFPPLQTGNTKNKITRGNHFKHVVTQTEPLWNRLTKV